MKIGIMTFWWSNDNYGQLLQCYALQKYLRDAGHDAYLIRYEASIDKKTPLYLRLIKSLNVVRLVRYVRFLIGQNSSFPPNAVFGKKRLCFS